MGRRLAELLADDEVTTGLTDEDAVPDVPERPVTVAGDLWVMGDHRSDSADSRAHLGDPGGGTVPEDRVIGKVVAIYWPLGRVGSITPAPELAKIPTVKGSG